MKQTTLFQFAMNAPTALSKMPLIWTHHETVLITESHSIKASFKIAAFDLDGTLITTVSGKKFAEDAKDWKFLFPNVMSTLKRLNTEGYKVVIFSNQRGFSHKHNGPQRIEEMKQKMKDIEQILDIPVQCFFSIEDDLYRKPNIDMWDCMESAWNQGVCVDRTQSFYVGDAAGRYNKDFSCSDQKFALNLSVPFYTPEAYFLGRIATDVYHPKFDPRTLMSVRKCFHAPEDTPLVPTDRHAELLIFVGCPTSGKSSLYHRYFQTAGYIHVNQDRLKTHEQCLAVCEAALKIQHSVVIDNTNYSRKVRQDFIAMAKSYAIPVRCFYFDVSMEVAQHLNAFRAFCSLLRRKRNGHEPRVKRIPDVAYYSYRSQFEAPSLAEGFSEIKTIHFVVEPTIFANNEEKALLLRFLI